MKIKYCCKNLKRCDGKPTVRALKDEYPAVKLKKKDCLGRCGACKKGAIAKVGKAGFVCASDPDTLYAEIKRILSDAG